MTTVHEYFRDQSLGKIRWLEAGEGEPVLLLHGMGAYSSANLFDYVIPEVAKKKHVYALDWLGFGKGVRELEEGPTFELMQEHLREFMDLQGIERADILGHSMGGWIAAQFAHQSPSRFRRLIMLCAAGMNLAPAGGIRFAKLPSADDLRAMFVGSMLKKEQADPAIVDAVVATAHRMITAPGGMSGIEPLLHQMEVPSLRDRYMLQRRLPFIRVPTLMVWGEADVFEPYPTWNAEYAKTGGDVTKSSKPWAVPGAKFLRLATGHFPHVEKPSLVSDLVLDFFRD